MTPFIATTIRSVALFSAICFHTWCLIRQEIRKKRHVTDRTSIHSLVLTSLRSKTCQHSRSSRWLFLFRTLPLLCSWSVILDQQICYQWLTSSDSKTWQIILYSRLSSWVMVVCSAVWSRFSCALRDRTIFPRAISTTMLPMSAM